MRRLIFLDIDGTILDGSRGMPEISDKTKYAVRKLKENGDYVFIASGRCKGLLSKQIWDLEPNGYVLCNGAYGEFEGREVYSYCFDEDVLQRIIEVADRYDGFYIFETLKKMYVKSLDGEVFNSFIRSWNITKDGFLEGRDDDPVQIAMIGFRNYDDFRNIEDDLKEHADVVPHNGFPSFDVNVKNINKGTGVIRISEYLDVDRENTYCFGDGFNDLEMLKEVGHPVTMGNCDKALDVYGFEKTADVLDEGVYEYLVKHKLIKAL